MALNKAVGQDTTHMWVWGHDGWYIAAQQWNEGLAEHWRGMGYRVERSVLKPEGK